MRFVCRYVSIVLAVAATAGCQIYRAPGALLPSLAASQQDRSIEKFAASSQFPSPSDVGLQTDEE